MDLFLVYAYQDQQYANGVEDLLTGRGLVIGEPLSLWPGQRLLRMIDLRLPESRFALVIISREFLRLSYPRKELDDLTNRRKVVSVLSDVDERAVAPHSAKLAVAALWPSENLVRLFRRDDLHR